MLRCGYPSCFAMTVLEAWSFNYYLQNEMERPCVDLVDCRNPYVLEAWSFNYSRSEALKCEP